jgi:hypothetical protein
MRNVSNPKGREKGIRYRIIIEVTISRRKGSLDFICTGT